MENDIQKEREEQKERGRRIQKIREGLGYNKIQMGEKIGVSGQFIGLVEEGKGNLVYKSIKKLREISGYSSDYILFGLDDKVIDNTKKLLENYTEEQITNVIGSIQDIVLFIKHDLR